MLGFLTHWGRVAHICVSKLTIIGSDNGLSPGWRQAIIWTSDGILLIGPFGTKFSEILSEIHTFSFKKMHVKTSSAKWRPFCLGLNVFTHKRLRWVRNQQRGCRCHDAKSTRPSVATLPQRYQFYWTSFVPKYYIRRGKYYKIKSHFEKYTRWFKLFKSVYVPPRAKTPFVWRIKSD